MKVVLALCIVILTLGCTTNKNPHVRLSTEIGDIEIEVFEDKAPITAGNFLKYVDNGKYNHYASFYRVVRKSNQPGKLIKIEVIQGGFFEDSLIEKFQYTPIKHETTSETGVMHKNGVLSMARGEPGTASSEFFICIGDQPELNFGGKRNPDGLGFAAFGKVISGMHIVRSIQMQKDTNQYLLSPIQIISISRESK